MCPVCGMLACSTCFGHQYAHHQELKSILQWLLAVVFRAVVFKLLVLCGADGSNRRQFSGPLLRDVGAASLIIVVGVHDY